ncbi:MAG: prepilin-type N-terminal cleavage/methylation domain-containing protein, partial [Nodosilinea sp.]
MADFPCRYLAKAFGLGSASSQRGFTLVEALIVVVIVGVLASLSIPTFMNQAARSRQTKTLKYIGLVNRAQQTFFVENQRFATSTAELGF